MGEENRESRSIARNSSGRDLSAITPGVRAGMAYPIWRIEMAWERERSYSIVPLLSGHHQSYNCGTREGLSILPTQNDSIPRHTVISRKTILDCHKL